MTKTYRVDLIRNDEALIVERVVVDESRPPNLLRVQVNGGLRSQYWCEACDEKWAEFLARWAVSKHCELMEGAESVTATEGGIDD